MGLLDGLLGNASKVDIRKIESEFAQLLADGERVEHAYQLPSRTRQAMWPPIR